MDRRTDRRTNGWMEGLVGRRAPVAPRLLLGPTLSCLLSSHPRTPGQCRCPHQHASEANPPSAHGPPVPCTPCRATRRLTCDAATDAVPGAASPACAYGSSTPEAEPGHPHSEAAGSGPCGDPTGARVQVGNPSRPLFSASGVKVLKKAGRMGRPESPLGGALARRNIGFSGPPSALRGAWALDSHQL